MSTPIQQDTDKFKHNSVRIAAFVVAIIVVLWTAFCITAALERFNRSELVPASNPDVSVSERLDKATTSLHKASRQVLAPIIVIADASGAVNAALPLPIKVTQYTPDTTINLSGLVSGTILSTGAESGDGQWRVAIDDLPSTRVIPPHEYVGSMTMVAELRTGDDKPIVRTPVQLSWYPAVTASTEALDQPSSTLAPSPADTMESKPAMLQQSPPDSTVMQTQRPKARRNTSSAIKASNFKKQHVARRHQPRQQSSDSEPQTIVDPHEELRPSFTIFADADVTRQQQQWNKGLHTTIDRSWERCGWIFGCEKEMRR